MSYWNGCCAKPGLLRVRSRGGRACYQEMLGCTLKSAQRRVQPLLNCSLSPPYLVLIGKEKEVLFLLVGPGLKDHTASLTIRSDFPSEVMSQPPLVIFIAPFGLSPAKSCCCWSAAAKSENLPPAEVPRLPAQPGRLPSPHQDSTPLAFARQCDHWPQTTGFSQSTALVPLNSNSVLCCAQVPPSCTSNNHSLVPPPNHEWKHKTVAGSGSYSPLPPFLMVSCW